MEDTRIGSSPAIFADSLIPSETINELLEPLQVAILLGANIPVLIGTYGYLLFEGPSPLMRQNMIHGVFQSFEAAERRQAQLLLDRCMPNFGPWQVGAKEYLELPPWQARKAEYVNSHPPKAIILWAKENNISQAMGGGFSIECVSVLPDAELKAELTLHPVLGKHS